MTVLHEVQRAPLLLITRVPRRKDEDFLLQQHPPTCHRPEGGRRVPVPSRTPGSPPPLRPLLQVLQDAAVAEVVDVAAEVHQLGVDVGGHAAVEGGGEVRATGHHAGAARRGALGPPLHQGTKSERGGS